MSSSPPHVIALSAKAADPESRYGRALGYGFALEYTPDPERLYLLPYHTGEFRRRNIPVRYHTRYFGLELGDARPDMAEKAFDAHRRTLDAMAEAGGSVITVHAGLSKEIELDFSTVEVNLKRLADHGRILGITVCLENLRSGPASDPENILRWASSAGTAITMDVGHVVSSGAVKSGEADGGTVARQFAPRMKEVHFYGREEVRHWPLAEMGSVMPLADAAIEAGVRWWTVELEEYVEALTTRAVLAEYLRGRGEPVANFAASSGNGIIHEGKGKS